MPVGTRRLDLEAALGRYRCLFDHDVFGWDAFIDTLLRPLPTWVWANPMRIDGTALCDLLAEQGIAAEPITWLDQGGAQPVRERRAPSALRLPAGFKAGQHWWYCAGLAHAQEAVSQLPVMLLAPEPGHRVLDLCAAPGGKTAQLAMTMDNQGTLIANDFAPERIAALQGNLDRLGVVNASTTRCDGGNFPPAAGGFDRVLVDAPCSSEGTLRRNPSLASPSRAKTALAGPESAGTTGLSPAHADEITDRDQRRRAVSTRPQASIGPERSRRMAGRQRALLRKATQLCRPGGRILYSTCTFAPEENELIVADILDEQKGDLALVRLDVPGLSCGPGVTRWQGRQLDPSLARCLRLWPHANDTGGFFIALLEKSPRARDPGEAKPALLNADSDDPLWLDRLRTHYGLPASALAAYRIQRQTRRGLHLVAGGHAPPEVPAAQGTGLFAYRTNIRPPKLTTAAALLLGPAATRNRLALTSAQRDLYLRRTPLTPSAAQTADCRPGQVIVTYRGYPLGVAVLHRSGELESLFPRRWSGCMAGV